jgi:hypothetical protein
MLMNLETYLTLLYMLASFVCMHITIPAYVLSASNALSGVGVGEGVEWLCDRMATTPGGSRK